MDKNRIGCIVVSDYSRKKIFTTKVRKWSKIGLRTFPWRQTTNPWHILLAEILLRKTTARQVESAYLPLIKEIPRPKSVYLCDEMRISKIMTPLGLKKRVSIIMNLGKLICNHHHGRVPQDLETLLSLPHVGQYTARAVRCFAYNKREVVIDVNVARVISRFFGLELTPRIINKPYENKQLFELVWSVLPLRGVRTFNWALLDIGSIVCTLNKPKCLNCPLVADCSSQPLHNEKPV